MKTFKYKNYKNCYFTVGSYVANNEVMAISIQNAEEDITICTIYDDIMSIPSESIVLIKNYSENSHMTEFLQKLGVVTDIIERIPCNSFVYDTLNSKNPQTLDLCVIDTNVLKKYCKTWNYKINTD